MSKHYNPSITKRQADIFNTKHANHMSSKVNDNITPTIEIAPTLHIVKNLSGDSGTLYTTPSDKDFYLTNLTVIAMGNNIGAGPGIAFSDIIFTLDSGEQAVFTATAPFDATGLGALGVTHQFGHRGIKLKRGTVVTASMDNNGSFTIVGYTEEVKKDGV